MNYADKCMISILANKAASATDKNILCYFGVLKGKNTASICVDGKESLFTVYEDCKAFLNSL